MPSVVFIGHSECYGLSVDALRKTIELCIQKGAVEFYSGGQGDFDRVCARVVYDFKKQYPHLRNTLVIPYLSFSVFNRELFDEIVYPEELETLHFKSAIPQRNRYMVNHSNIAICYIDHSWGNAAKTYAFAQKQQLEIWNLAEIT